MKSQIPLGLQEHSTTFSASSSAFADDTLFLGSNKEDIQRTIDTSNEFFAINDIKINGDKSELIVLNSSQLPEDEHVTMGDLNTIVPANHSLMDIRFLGVYLRSKKGYDHIIRHMREIILDFNRQLSNKRMTSSLHTYLANRVLIPKLEYMHQTAIINERTLHSLYKPIIRRCKSIAKLPRTANNNIVHHTGFYGLTSLIDNYTEAHITSIIRRINSNNTDGITTRIRLEDARYAEASISPLITLPSDYNLSRQNLLRNLALFEIVLCDTNNIKLHNETPYKADNHTHGLSDFNRTDINFIIYNHLFALPKSQSNNAKINNTLKGLSKMSELGILQDTDMIVPGLSISKSWQH